MLIGSEEEGACMHSPGWVGCLPSAHYHLGEERVVERVALVDSRPVLGHGGRRRTRRPATGGSHAAAARTTLRRRSEAQDAVKRIKLLLLLRMTEALLGRIRSTC